MTEVIIFLVRKEFTMNWTYKKSLKLSTYSLYLFGTILLLSMVFISPIVELIVPLHAVSVKNHYLFFITLEVCLGLALVILFYLNKLIKNIDKNNVFSSENVRILRIISWLCNIEGLMLLISSIYYLPWIFVAGLGVFVGLIVRVVKNVFCQAILIKDENDYTI